MLCFLGSVSEPLWETFFPFFLFWVGHFSIHPFGFGLLLFFFPASCFSFFAAACRCALRLVFFVCVMWIIPWVCLGCTYHVHFLCVMLCLCLIDVFLGSCTLCCIKLNQSRRSRKAATSCHCPATNRPAASHQPLATSHQLFAIIAASRLHTWRLNFLVLNSCINSKLSLCNSVEREERNTREKERGSVFKAFV